MIRTLSLLCALAVAPVFAVPPPMPQVTADCAAPSYASDFLVCSDDELLELDSALAARIAARSRPLAAGVETDDDWFRRSRRCAFETNHRSCLLAAYCERIQVIDGTAAEAGEEPNPTAHDASLLRICHSVGFDLAPM